MGSAFTSTRLAYRNNVWNQIGRASHLGEGYDHVPSLQGLGLRVYGNTIF